jgi:hypothetical protein
MRELLSRYLIFLLGSDAFVDVSLAQALWVSLDREKHFFDLWRSFPYEVRFLDYS